MEQYKIIQAHNEEIKKIQSSAKKAKKEKRILTLEVRQLRAKNDELQDARKELINCLKEQTETGSIGVKRMGQIDIKPFHETLKRKYRSDLAADVSAMTLCSTWQSYIDDPNWHPMKVIEINGKPEAVIIEEDEKLKYLMGKYGDQMYSAVTKAFFELNEYNASGRNVIEELWNYGECRKATLKEGVAYLRNYCKLPKKKNQKR